jgi:hypothetical protein
MRPRALLSTYLLLITLGVTAVVVAAQQQDEVQTLINASQFLETQPLDKKAKDIRGKAILWVIQTDKVSVKACSLLLSGVEEKYKYSGDLVTQYTIGMAAFKLANPDKAGDDDAVQLAGVESAMRSYEAMLKTQPKAQHKFMDELVAKRSSNTLAEYVKANNCKDKK